MYRSVRAIYGAIHQRRRFIIGLASSVLLVMGLTVVQRGVAVSARELADRPALPSVQQVAPPPGTPVPAPEVNRGIVVLPPFAGDSGMVVLSPFAGDSGMVVTSPPEPAHEPPPGAAH